MKTLVVYDSVHGNTEKLAKAIGEAVTGGAEVLKAGSTDPKGLSDVGLLVMGCPTHGGRPSPAMKGFLDGVPDETLKGLRIAVFDTRFASRMTKIFGYAADRASKALEAKGAVLVAPPEGFIVKGTEGPLKEGELERATAWAKKLA